MRKNDERQLIRFTSQVSNVGVVHDTQEQPSYFGQH